VSLTIGTSSGPPLYKRYGAYTCAPVRRSIHSERLNVTSAIIEEERARNGERQRNDQSSTDNAAFRHYPRH